MDVENQEGDLITLNVDWKVGDAALWTPSAPSATEEGNWAKSPIAVTVVAVHDSGRIGVRVNQPRRERFRRDCRSVYLTRQKYLVRPQEMMIGDGGNPHLKEILMNRDGSQWPHKPTDQTPGCPVDMRDAISLARESPGCVECYLSAEDIETP